MAHQTKKNRELANNTGSTSGGGGWYTEMEIGDEEDE